MGTALIERGLDVLPVAQAFPGASDELVAHFAQANGMVIVTQDYDFGELAVRWSHAVPGIVLVACQALPLPVRAQRTADIVATNGVRLLGMLTIIEAKRVRQRPIGSLGDG